MIIFLSEQEVAGCLKVLWASQWTQAERNVFRLSGVISVLPWPLVLPQTMDADHSKSPEGLLGVLGHMLSGKSLDLLLAAAAATGKLKSFARKFIK